jgi:N4-gp56 family major capsid protein
MSNTYTSTDSGSLGTSLIQNALDKYVRFKLRAQPMFRGLADSRPVDQTYPSSSVTFQFWNELPSTTSPELSETVDPDAIGVPSTSSISVTLKEYGMPIIYTRKLQLTSITDVTEGMADLLAFHMRDAIDKLVSPVLDGGTHVIRSNSTTLKSDMLTGGAGSAASIGTSDLFDSRFPRLATAKFRGNKVVPRQGELYAAFIHPDISHDLRKETGAAAWRDPHIYSGAEQLWTGSIGVYEGVYWIETPRMPIANTAASSAANYSTWFLGREALAEAVAEEFSIRQGPTTDKLGRFTVWGWYGMAGWARFREDALIRAESQSSIAS